MRLWWVKKKKESHKEKVKKEIKKVILFVGSGAGIGALKGGALGVVGFGPAIGIAVPLVIVGATGGGLVYGAYKFFQSCKKKKRKTPPKNQTLNYVVCVSIGCALGIGLCTLYHAFF